MERDNYTQTKGDHIADKKGQIVLESSCNASQLAGFDLLINF